MSGTIYQSTADAPPFRYLNYFGSSPQPADYSLTLKVNAVLATNYSPPSIASDDPEITVRVTPLTTRKWSKNIQGLINGTTAINSDPELQSRSFSRSSNTFAPPISEQTQEQKLFPTPLKAQPSKEMSEKQCFLEVVDFSTFTYEVRRRFLNYTVLQQIGELPMTMGRVEQLEEMIKTMPLRYFFVRHPEHENLGILCYSVSLSVRRFIVEFSRDQSGELYFKEVNKLNSIPCKISDCFKNPFVPLQEDLVHIQFNCPAVELFNLNSKGSNYVQVTCFKKYPHLPLIPALNQVQKILNERVPNHYYFFAQSYRDSDLLCIYYKEKGEVFFQDLGLKIYYSIKEFYIHKGGNCLLDTFLERNQLIPLPLEYLTPFWTDNLGID